MRACLLLGVVLACLAVVASAGRGHPRSAAGVAASPPRPPTGGLGAPPEIIRGVNLGGWLVLEPWITPSLFQPWLNSTNPAVDEWTFCELLGPEEAARQLEAHWDGWVQQDDLATLAKAGITHLRVPIGYWAISVEQWEPYQQGQWRFLTRMLSWASDLGLKVLIDLHGLPGSQNGFDNSGRRGDIHWMDTPGTNLLRSYYIVANLTSLLAPFSQDVGGPVMGIELVNEPFDSIPLPMVQGYYTQGYQIIRESGLASSTLGVFIHDSFRLGSWSNFMEPPQYQNVTLDTHMYHVFDMGLLQMNESQHLDYVCNNVQRQEHQAAQYLWLVTGEWSLATTDCATWLNGFQKGSRWDGTLNPGVPGIGQCTGNAGNDFSQFSPDYIHFLRVFAETQMDVYEAAGGPGGNSAGWFFWNFKTEQSPQWDFLMGLANGYIPNPVTSRTHNCTDRRRRRRTAHHKARDAGATSRGLTKHADVEAV